MYLRMFYFLRCIEILDDIPVSNDDQKKGVEIVRHALQQPTRQIADNAGEDASVVVNKVRTSDDHMDLLIISKFLTIIALFVRFWNQPSATLGSTLPTEPTAT